MSFYSVNYSSLGMSAFWEIDADILKICEICGFFSGGRWEWTWASFRVDFETILGAIGRQSRKKGDPETLTKNDGKKFCKSFRVIPSRGGGGP